MEEIPEIPELTELRYFPYPESSWIELKNAYTSCHYEKIIQTICAFLNTKGGYMIFGVNNDREITGVGLKGYDGFALKIDDIYHRNLITQEDGRTIDPKTITINLIKTQGDKNICVIRVRTEKGKTYCIAKDNTVWYRLNASNYKCRTLNVTYTRKEFEKAVKMETKRLKDTVSILVSDTRGYAKLASEIEAKAQEKAEEYEKEKRTMEAKIEKMQKEAEEERRRIEEKGTEEIHRIILKKKEIAEENIELSRISKWSIASLICGMR